MMINWAETVSAFVVGVLAAGHCVAMCGGISSAISLNISNQKSNAIALFFYHAGRLTSYAFLGAIAGGGVSELVQITQWSHGFIVLRFLAGIMIIVLALYIARVWNGLAYIEKIGQKLWKYIAPFTAHFLPLHRPISAFPLGVIWGWLPCGLVYSALSWAAISGSFIGGSLIMLAFGFGTLPAMLLVGTASSATKKMLNNMIFRYFFALCLFLYGLRCAYLSALKF